MADSFAIARLKARLAPHTNGRGVYARTPEERAELLVRAVTMAEIAEVARLLGLTFREAYRQRAELYQRPLSQWPLSDL
jgi:hypothetical protein